MLHGGSPGLLPANNLSDVASPLGVAQNIAGSYTIASGGAKVSLTGSTTLTTLATVTIPANALLANGRIEIFIDGSASGSGGTRTFSVALGGSSLAWAGLSSSSTVLNGFMSIANRNATNAQRWTAFGSTGNNNFSNVSTTSALDTTGALTLLIQGQLGSSADTMNLESYRVMLLPHS
jgi:hypothetical protein